MSGSCWLGVMESISPEEQDSQNNVFKKSSGCGTQGLVHGLPLRHTPSLKEEDIFTSKFSGLFSYKTVL